MFVPNETFDLTDWDDWFLTCLHHMREYHPLTGNMKGAPGSEVFRKGFAEGKSPEEAVELYKQADSTFFKRSMQSVST